MCGSQRSGDYEKWKWFDYCLCRAIHKLSLNENGKFKVYTGLHGVKMNEKQQMACHFGTYVSTSWNRSVAEAFTNGNGMLIEIETNFKEQKFTNNHCCDVSWISKFGASECEILFSRVIDGMYFDCNVLEEFNGIQIVSLTNTIV